MLEKTADDLFDSLIPLMKRYGVRHSPSEFYEAVNLHFHAAESLVYDEIHQGMWQALPRQFDLLTDDCSAVAPTGKLRVLDIGCGTGLSAELFLKTRLGSRVHEIHLLDTSKEMLTTATRRARNWPVNVTSYCGKISNLPAAQRFDVILASSVLHHIADLQLFLNQVAERQSAGGLFLHFQDPNADHADDLDHLSRLTAYNAARRPARRTPLLRRLTPKRIYKRILRQLLGRQDYISQTNRSLMRADVIEREMSDADIWLVTDIRVSPVTKGISLQDLKSKLPRYELVSSRSYEFFGDLETLPEPFRSRENQLIVDRSMTGGLFAAAWKLP